MQHLRTTNQLQDALQRCRRTHRGPHPVMAGSSRTQARPRQPCRRTPCLQHVQRRETRCATSLREYQSRLEQAEGVGAFRSVLLIIAWRGGAGRQVPLPRCSTGGRARGQVPPCKRDSAGFPRHCNENRVYWDGKGVTPRVCGSGVGPTKRIESG